MKTHPAQTNFTGGEISPLMRGRVDVKKLQNGASLLQNCIVHPQGGSRRRFGTRGIYKTKLTSASRLISFVFSDQQAYVLEFGDQYIHFIKNKERLFETTTTEIESFFVANSGGLFQIQTTFDELPGWGDLSAFGAGVDVGTATQSAGAAGVVRITTSIPHTLRTGAKVFMRSAADPNSINNIGFTVNRISNFAVDLVGSAFVSTAGITDTGLFSHGLLPGDRFFVSGATNYPELSEKFHTVKSVPDWDRFDVANVAYVNHGLPTGEEVHCIPIEISTPYLSTELADLQVAQSADVIYIAHPNHPPMKLTRLDDDGDRNDWLLSEVSFYDGPYLPLNNLSPNIDTTTPQNGARYTDVYLEISSYAHTATVTAAVAFAGGGPPSTDQGKYLEYRDRDQWRLALVTAMAPGATSGTVSIIDNVLIYMDETLKLKNRPDRAAAFVPGTAGNSGAVPNTTQNRYGQTGNWSRQRIDPNNSVLGAAVAGDFTAQYANTFGAADVGRYVRFGTSANPPVFAWALIDGVSKTNGTQAHHAASVTMVSNNGTGKFIITNEVKSCVVKSFRNNVAFNMFAATDVGRHIRLGFGGRWAWGKITTFTSESQVTVTLTDELPRDPNDANNVAGNQNTATPTTGITYDWRLGAWSVTTGYPACVVFHEQRLCFARTLTEPQNLWMSKSASYEDMSPTEPDGTVTDESGIAYTLVSGKVSPINWLVSGPVLLVGGEGQEWQVRAASSTEEPISALNVKVTPQTDFGSATSIRAFSVGPATLFVDRVHRKLREMTYNFELDRHIATDISIVSEHLFRYNQSIIDADYQKNPFGVVWLVTNTGVVLSMTYEKDHEITAWTQQSIAGLLAAAKSVAVIPSSSSASNIDNKGHDEVYFVVSRFVNGGLVNIVEVLFQNDVHGSVYSGLELHNTPFMDQYMAIEAPASRVITGLNNYEGATVSIYVDSVMEATQVVTGGSITTVNLAPSFVTIGFVPVSRVRILPGDGGAFLGTSQTKTRRVNKVGLRVLNTTSVKITTLDFMVTETREFPTPFYSGDVVFPLIQGYNKTGEFIIMQDLNAPMEILLVAPEGAVYEEQ